MRKPKTVAKRTGSSFKTFINKCLKIFPLIEQIITYLIKGRESSLKILWNKEFIYLSSWWNTREISWSFAYLLRRIRGQFYFQPIIFSNWKSLWKSFRNLGAVLTRKHFRVSLLYNSQRRLLLTLLVTDVWVYLTQFWHYLPGSCVKGSSYKIVPLPLPISDTNCKSRLSPALLTYQL